MGVRNWRLRLCEGGRWMMRRKGGGGCLVLGWVAVDFAVDADREEGRSGEGGVDVGGGKRSRRMWCGGVGRPAAVVVAAGVRAPTPSPVRVHVLGLCTSSHALRLVIGREVNGRGSSSQSDDCRSLVSGASRSRSPPRLAHRLGQC